VRPSCSCRLRPIATPDELTSETTKSLRQTSHRDRAVAVLADLNYLVSTTVGKAEAVYLNPRSPTVDG
jgi:hypothetical protein